MTYILYHNHCTDGSGAAYAAYKRFGSQATYIAMNYQDPLPEILDGEIVYLLDYSRSWKDILAIRDRGCYVYIIDHHKSALSDALCLLSEIKPDLLIANTLGESFDDLIDFRSLSQKERDAYVKKSGLWGLEIKAENLFVYFNLRNSGAVLAWEHFHASTETPDLLSYVEDRDLWKFLLPGSREHCEGLFSHLTEQKDSRHHQWRWNAALQLHSESPDQVLFDGFDITTPGGFIPESLNNIAEGCRKLSIDPQVEALSDLGVWERLIEIPIEERRSLLITKGAPILKEKMAEVEKVADTAKWGRINGYSVPVVYATRHHSEIGHELCARFPEALFSASWSYAKDDPHLQVWNLRSNGGFDCSIVAESLGGGGHEPSAGFRIYRISRLEVGSCFHWVDDINNPVQIGADNPENQLIPWQIIAPQRMRCLLDLGEEFSFSQGTEITSEVAKKWAIKIKQ